LYKFVLLTVGIIFCLDGGLFAEEKSTESIAELAIKSYKVIEKEEMNCFDISPTYAKKKKTKFESFIHD
jgi:hypothetical protein